MCNSYAMGWADRTGRELYHCWCRAPKAGTALVQIQHSEKRCRRCYSDESWRRSE
ncbi:hypothetical protein C4J91_0978 [Pseudomonas sp. R3-52-08]|nr:hypothetical protein C4J91_0978 [Pseudomonas sp. R3-52-08]